MKNNSAMMGFAEVDITPKHPVQTIGFNRVDNLSKGILHPLFAQISIWKFGNMSSCLVAIDHIGFDYQGSQQLRGQIATRLEISKENVMLCFSHTHSSPNISIEQEYFKFMCDRIMSGVSEAMKTISTIKAVSGNCIADIGINRRNGQGNLDRRIGILKIVDEKTDKLRLVLLRVTAHAMF